MPDTVVRPNRPAVRNPKAAAPAMGNDSPDSSEEMGFFRSMGRLLLKHAEGDKGDAQDHALGGLTRRRKVDALVDEAVNGAKDDPI